MVNCLNIKNSKYIREIKIETGECLSLIKVFGYQQQIKDLFEKEKQINIAIDNEDDNVLLSNLESCYQDRFIFYLIIKNETLIAFAMVSNDETDFLSRLYTSVNYRQLGLGTILLNESKKTTLYCIIDNKEALKFYEKNNFIVQSTFSHTYKLTKR